MSQVAKSSIIVTIYSALGLCLGLLSNVVIAAKFGASQDMDIFLAATTVPLFITSILSGSLNLTFIPVFAEYRSKEPNEIWKVVSSFINLNIVITTVLCAIGIYFAYPIVSILVPGFDEEKLIKSAVLLQWLFPSIILNVVNALMASVYYSNQRFVIPSLNNIVSPLLVMAYVTLFHNYLSTASIVLAILTSSIIQVLLLVAGFIRTRDFKYYFVFNYKHPGVLKILKLMIPLVLGMLIYRAIPIFDSYILSGLPNGSISHIGYAQKLLAAIPQLITSGISIAIFPLMAKYAAEHKWIDLKQIMSKGIRQVLFLVIPTILFLCINGIAIIKLVYERGAFGPDDSIAVGNAFTIYLLSLVFSTANNITNCYYVLNDTFTPFVIGAISAITYVCFCLLLLKLHFGYLALPVAYFVYYSFVIAHAVIIRKKLGGNGGKSILKSICNFTVVSSIIASMLYWSNYYVSNVVVECCFIVVSFISYYMVCYYVLHLEEAKMIHVKITNTFIALNSVINK